MTITLLIVFFLTSVCHGAVTTRGENCSSDLVLHSVTSDCAACICKPGGSLRNCTPRPCSPSQFSDNFPTRRKRDSDNGTSESPVVTEAEVSTSGNVTTADAQLLAEAGKNTSPVTAPTDEVLVPGASFNASESPESASAVLTISAPTSSSSTIKADSSPPHPSTTQATAVKPRTCKSGSTWEEECNTCWCLDNGMAACTVKRCEAVTPLPPTTATVLQARAAETPVEATTPTSTSSSTSSTLNASQSSSLTSTSAPSTDATSATQSSVTSNSTGTS